MNCRGTSSFIIQSVALQPGDLYFEDVNGDGVVDDDDKRVIGNPHPKFTYGFNVNGNYRDLDVSASFNGSYGNKVLDGQDYYLFNMEGSGNQYSVVGDRYRNPEIQEMDGYTKLHEEVHRAIVLVFLRSICRMVLSSVALTLL